ncbi:precorrin-8X methylmutase [Thermohalobaculum sediminis]|uniref:precorrin-8X methylmutase n=1 Tax=Thermohalobaculum sediminis TaxID=2939436 RepID=UPI0029E80384|nr:precorrin-8X methylmutase [Limibaculum sediminis]
MTRLFDSVLIVDWSSAATPARGANSIWLALARDGALVRHENPATRAEAVELIADILAAEADAGRRILAGFDFPLGYPRGTARAVAGADGWRALWDHLADGIEDGPGNANNRFVLAAALNARFPGEGPFWGRPRTHDLAALPERKPARHPAHPPERRAVERVCPRTQPVWKLYTTGAVGGQVLTGIPALARLRADPRLAGRCAVWPFEGGMAVPDAPVVIAEIYPSLLDREIRAARRADEPLDAAQTRVTALAYAGLDRAGGLAALFAGAPGLDADTRAAAETEEAWILGVGHEAALREAARGLAPAPAVIPFPRRAALRYERDPHAIYRQSWATVRAETRLDHLPADLHDVAIRMVHACGMTDVPSRLAWSDDVAASARSALAAGAPILCDAGMVAQGIVAARLPARNPVVCTLDDPAAASLAAEIGNTRSAAAVRLWRERIAGAVVAIGNAPTALFHLLELLDEGWPRPAAIIGLPVGFVGAAESKAELARDPRGVPFLTLRGRRGGSAMAAAAVNALAAGLEAPR